MFLAYLRGIETCWVRSRWFSAKPFLAYLRGIETNGCDMWVCGYGLVFSVPKRNWNLAVTWQAARHSRVFSVPKRNWNYTLEYLQKNGYIVFSVPKRNWNWRPCRRPWRVASVFSVPKRNWNTCCQWRPSSSPLFLAYLRGIETRDTPTKNQALCCF